jgi:hypothetical protein
MILDWLESRGVKELARIPMNSQILDDDDVHDVWTHVLERRARNKAASKKMEVLSLKPSSLYKVNVGTRIHSEMWNRNIYNSIFSTLV